MSLKYRDSQGNETPVAGLNGTSGELVPSTALVLTGTISLPEQAAHSQSDMTIQLPQRMPDSDYEVFFEQTFGNQGYRILTVHGKSIDTFALTSFNADVGVAVATSVSYKVVKLMTDTVHEADSAHIAQNTANFAPAFSEVTSYAVGDYVTYNNILYRCTTAHTAGAWVAGHFTQVTVGGTLGAIVPSDASASNKLVTESEAELSTIPLSKFQVSSGGAVGYADLGATTTTISQAFSWLEVEYGRVDGFIDKYFISVAGASSNQNYIRVVRLTNYGQTPTITLDANKHIWMSMDTYVYIRVKAYGNFSISGELSRTAPTGTVIPINRLVTGNEINPTLTATFAKASGLKSGGVTITGCKKIGENLAVVSGYINKSSVLTVAAYQSNIGSLSISGKTALGSNPTSLFLWSQGQTPQCASCTWKTTGDWMAVPFGDGDVTLSEDAWFNAIVRYQ